MTACRHEKSIRAWVRGELSPGKVQRLREHTRGCPACKTYYSRLVEAERLLSHPATTDGGVLAVAALPTHFEIERGSPKS